MLISAVPVVDDSPALVVGATRLCSTVEKAAVEVVLSSADEVVDVSASKTEADVVGEEEEVVMGSAV